MTNPEPEVMESTTIRVKTPDGKMFVAIMEHEGKPWRVKITIGKAGAPIQAWSDTTADLISLALAAHVPMWTIINQIDGHSSDRAVFDGALEIKSGPAGLAYALKEYMYTRKIG